MANLSTLTGLYRRLLRSRVAAFLVMAAAAYALFSDAPARGQALPNACAAASYDSYRDSIPFGRQFPLLATQCQPCHSGTSTLSAFGNDYAPSPDNSVVFGSVRVRPWTVALATADSDGDGYTNGEELQNPAGDWARGSGDPAGGSAARVRNPNSAAAIPPAPTISQLLGVTAGGTSRGTVTLQVQLDTMIGARSVLYEILNASSQVVQSFPKQTASYASLTSVFNQIWDTNTLPNGTYTVRATLTDATGLVGRKSTLTVANVTLDNGVVRYVATGGADAGNCANSVTPCASLGYAVGQSLNKDEIRIAVGTYPVGSGASALGVAKQLSLRGGYTVGNWATPDPQANLTTLDGQGLRPVLSFTAGANGFKVSGLTIANGAGALGGGASVTGATGSFSQVIFSANQSSGNGGALAVAASGGATLERVSFLGNTAAGQGGAIFSQAGLTMTNVVFGRNGAAQGGAIAISGAASSSITYATVSGASRPEAAILLGGTSMTAITNSLISGYATGARLGLGVSLALQSALVANDVTTPTDPQGGSVSGRPLRGLAGYVDAAADNYRLRFGAPAINAGVATPGTSTDHDGNTRPVDSLNDIGAYEFQGPSGELYFRDVSLNVQQPASTFTMEVRLSLPSLSPVTVHYATTAGTAANGVDYIDVSGDLTFAPGETSKLIDISALTPSPAATLPRSLSIKLSAASGAKLGTGQNDRFSSATITLLPPPDPPRVTLSVIGADASRRGPRAATIIFDRDIATNTPMTVSYTVGGDAQAGVDYAPLSGTITFPAGALSATLRIEPIGGSGTRLLTVTLKPGAAYLLGRTSATVRISGVLRWLIYTPLIQNHVSS